MKKFLFTLEDKHYYDDMTYRCDHWEPDDFTEIRFIPGDIEFRHRNWPHWESFLQCPPISPSEIAKIKQLYEEHATHSMEEAFGLASE